jgi:hypothetical protein
MIDGEIHLDERIGSLNYFGRLVWFVLITGCADDQGRFIDNPAIIKAKGFPYDPGISDLEVEESLKALEGSIYRYSRNGKHLAQIVNWWKYQRPSWAAPSKYPAPEGWIDRIKIHIPGNKVITENWDKPGGFIDNSIPSPVHTPVHTPVPTPLHTSVQTALPTTVHTHLPTPVPTLVHIAIEKSEIKSESEFESEFESESEGEGEIDKNLSSSSAYLALSDNQKVYFDVTGQYPTIKQIPEIEHSINTIRNTLYFTDHPNELQGFLEELFERWLNSTNKSGNYYKPNNPGWLDWGLDQNVRSNWVNRKKVKEEVFV